MLAGHVPPSRRIQGPDRELNIAGDGMAVRADQGYRQSGRRLQTDRHGRRPAAGHFQRLTHRRIGRLALAIAPQPAGSHHDLVSPGRGRSQDKCAIYNRAGSLYGFVGLSAFVSVLVVLFPRFGLRVRDSRPVRQAFQRVSPRGIQ